ncbi:MAG: hypothetical protein WCJ30_19785, partial [Deltaproteobacteria bacterium]
MPAGATVDRFEVRVTLTPPQRRMMGLAPPSRAALDAAVWINGVQDTRDAVSIEALLVADADATIFPYTCQCGEPGLRGTSARSRCTTPATRPDETLWVGGESGQSYVFSRAAFAGEIARLRQALEAARTQWPDVSIGP